MDFSFMADDRYRVIAERDFEELQNLNTETNKKAVLVMAGSVIETLLTDALIVAQASKASGLKLDRKIIEAKKIGIIKQDVLTDAIRDYRNLVHPEKEIKQQYRFDQDDAKLARSGVNIVAREVSAWMNEAKREASLTSYLKRLDPNAKKILLLFSTVKPANSPFEHDLLTHEEYLAIETLVKDGILFREKTDSLAEYQEKICIVKNAKKLLESVVINGQVKRTEIVIDGANVVASGGGGTGAPSVSWSKYGTRRFS